MKTSRFSSLLLAVCAVLSVGSGTPLHAQTIPKGSNVVDLETFTTLPKSGGQFARVNVLRAAPDGRIFVNDQRGLLYLVSADGATVTQYLNLADRVPLLQDNGERGFQSFAFHPDFDAPGAAGYGKFYTMASQSDTSIAATFTPGMPGAGHDHDEVLLEWTAADPAAAVFAPADASHPFREVLRIARPNSNHNAGYLSFNPTATAADLGNLYLGTGDSGGGGDPLGLAQMPGKVYGAILRINPLLPANNAPNRSANGQYSIPTDNPYVTNPSLLREKFMMGFRNPQRFTWDSANGRLFVADIGQNRVEEIDVGQTGANYGWNAREGSYVYNSDGSIGANVRGDAAATKYVYPIAEYMHYGSSGNAVTTGPAYRGAIIPALAGRLLFSDFVNGVPYTLDADHLPDGGQSGITELRLRVNGGEQSFLDMIHQVNASASRADLRFGTDAAGNVYFLDKQDGVVRRVVTTPVVTPTPTPTPAPTPSPTPAPSLPTVSIEAAGGGRAIEGGENGKVVIRREGSLTGALTVRYKATGYARAGTDYKMLSGEAVIPAGVAKVKIKIKPIDDQSHAGTRKVKIKLKPAPDGSYLLGNSTVAVIKIIDDD